MRILQIIHGYPPRENAGTEEHAYQLVQALRARGHELHVFSATRAPGRSQYSLVEEPGITRVVNNISARALDLGERDQAIESAAAKVVRRFQPDIVHFQHIQFLSSGIRVPCPSVLTLHDQWAWCASGGLGIRETGASCDGPDPEQCAICHAAWRPLPGIWEQSLTQVAGGLSPWISPERLHRLYKRLPSSMRARAQRGRTPVESPQAADERNQAMLSFYRAATVRVSPSAWLARAAEAQGLGPVETLPHGMDCPTVRKGGGPMVFLGTIAAHKGPDLVVKAWRMAFPVDPPELVIHGPLVDPDCTLGHPISPPLDRPQVWELLSRAKVLILGSRWPENSPLVILEARAAGCPVVAPAVGGIPELIEHGVDGLLYPAGDVRALSKAIQEIQSRDWPDVRKPPEHAQQVQATLDIYQRLVPS
jgi:glycosyltransferase involved in cell wall biosynthesis